MQRLGEGARRLLKAHFKGGLVSGPKGDESVKTLRVVGEGRRRKKRYWKRPRAGAGIPEREWAKSRKVSPLFPTEYGGKRFAGSSWWQEVARSRRRCESDSVFIGRSAANREAPDPLRFLTLTAFLDGVLQPELIHRHPHHPPHHHSAITSVTSAAQRGR